MSLLTERRFSKEARRYYKHSAHNGAFPRPLVPRIGGHPNLLHTPTLDRRNCSAVNDVFASGDRGSTVRCQKRHQLGDFVRPIRPAERNAAE
ncbi:MAG: hypothetical protein QOH41_2718 [Blastocatellia bacterium]|nr:hypothetical protein [Blastocatellia bacterium]